MSRTVHVLISRYSVLDVAMPCASSRSENKRSERQRFPSRWCGQDSTIKTVQVASFHPPHRCIRSPQQSVQFVKVYIIHHLLHGEYDTYADLVPTRSSHTWQTNGWQLQRRFFKGWRTRRTLQKRFSACQLHNYNCLSHQRFFLFQNIPSCILYSAPTDITLFESTKSSS